MRWPWSKPRTLELDRDAVRAEFMLFLRCGGHVTLAEFSAMPAEVAEILAECHRAVRAELACAIARASESAEGFAEIQSMVDPDGVRANLLGAALDAGRARTGDVL